MSKVNRLFKHIIPNDGNVTCCRTLKMPICYKAAAIGQGLIDGQEVHKVKLKLPNLVSTASNVGGECDDR